VWRWTGIGDSCRYSPQKLHCRQPPARCNTAPTSPQTQVYQDSIRDLLAPSARASAASSGGALPRLPMSPSGVSPAAAAAAAAAAAGVKLLSIRDPDPTKEVVLTGQEEVQVTTSQQLLQCLLDGLRARSVAATNINAHSSRSHAIFSIHVVQTARRLVLPGTAEPQSPIAAALHSSSGSSSSSSCSSSSSSSCSSSSSSSSCSSSSSSSSGGVDYMEETLDAKLHLVDLAGSERLGKSGAQGARLLESCAINQGLLALGNVIDALSEGRQHVPYRDHVLCRLLRNALGGNSRTAMIACISPADVHASESVNTMK